MPIFFILFVILGIYVAFQRELLPDTAISSAWSRKFWQSFHLDLRTWTGIFLPVCCRQRYTDLRILSSGQRRYPCICCKGSTFDTLAAMLAALVIIPAMATTGAKLDQGGPGLLFIYLPHLIKTMPGGRIIAIIFFVAVFLAGMTSLMNLYEAPIATVQEKTGLGGFPPAW